MAENLSQEKKQVLTQDRNKIKQSADYQALASIANESKTYDGFYAVACAVRNRVKASKKTYQQVVSQPNQFAAYGLNVPLTSEASNAAIDVLAGGADTVNGYKFFFGRIGSHDIWYDADKVSDIPIVWGKTGPLRNVFYKNWGDLHNASKAPAVNKVKVYDGQTGTWNEEICKGQVPDQGSRKPSYAGQTAQSGSSSAGQSVQTAPSADGQTYSVKSGDSWWAIARKFGVSGGYKALAAYNGKTAADTIHPGDILHIPGSGANSPSVQSSQSDESAQKTETPSEKTNNQNNQEKIEAVNDSDNTKKTETEDKADGDWRADLIKAGLSPEEIYEGEDSLEYGHAKIDGEWDDKRKHKIVVGGKIIEGVGKNANAVKTLQALLNRSLKDTGLKEAKADSRTIQTPGTLVTDAGWGLNTATHLMYFIQMAGYTLKNNYIGKFTVKCDSNIWKDLRKKKGLDVSKIQVSSKVELAKIGSTGHKIVPEGAQAFSEMQSKYGSTIKIDSSFRAFSSHGMEKVGMPEYSGQLELFALRVAKLSTSDAAQPSTKESEKSHMTGVALDLNNARSWVKENGKDYGFKRLDSEAWHFNFQPEVWNQKKNK